MMSNLEAACGAPIPELVHSFREFVDGPRPYLAGITTSIRYSHPGDPGFSASLIT
jgi:hypothetical protein